MFEDSLMESDHRIKGGSKYWSLVAFFLNGGVVVALIVWPLMHPEALPRQMMAALLVAPAPPASAPPATPVLRNQPKVLATDLMTAPSRIPKIIRSVQEAETLPSMQDAVEGLAGNNPAGIESVIGDVGKPPDVVVKVAPPAKRISISSGVMDGNLVEKTVPQYPAIARSARIQGTVVVQAVISKAGLIEKLRVISGPPMLQQAAVDAIKLWKYNPYVLNGEPVEVETTVNVVFRLGE